MAHYLPTHGDPNLPPHTLQTALQMDPNHPPPPHMQGPPTQPPMISVPRKRKKVDPDSGEPAQPAEPRRLRRSHEACARCRSKKIKASPVGRHRRQIPVVSPISLRLTHLYASVSANSATQNILGAQHAPLLGYNAIRKTGTARPSLPAATPSTSNASSIYVSSCSSDIYRTLTSITSRKLQLGQA
jgi:hypothetical protein